ncbi:MAG: BatA domain-containing protein [Planctomycetes bacterium]|nr:BatA domain-containing protein [Planctomycetota bacterium]
MSWLAYTALFAMPAVLIPVILHFLGRPTPVETLFPAIQFLLRKKVAAARIYTLREIIILLCRMAVIAVAVLIIAGPKIDVSLPTCTEKDVISRDVILFLDNSPTSAYKPPEVAGSGITAFDLYRDLALTIASRVSDDRPISLMPVDPNKAVSVNRSLYHDQVRAALRAAGPGHLADIDGVFAGAYSGPALNRDALRPALVALSMADLSATEIDKDRVTVLQCRPLARMAAPRNYAITGGEFFLGSSPFSRNGVALDVMLPPGSSGARVTLLVDGTVQDAADCPRTGDGSETCRVKLSFTLPEARDALLEARLDPPDALPGDNTYRAVINVPPWPTMTGHDLPPGGRLDTALEALRSAAGGHENPESKVHVFLARGGEIAGLSGLSDEISRGAGCIVFLAGKTVEPADMKGFLPADPVETPRAAPVARGLGFALSVESSLSAALADAGITSGKNESILQALSGTSLYPLDTRAGSAVLLSVEKQPVVLQRTWGRGRVVVVGMDPEAPESPFARAPGTLLPFISETAFRTIGWHPTALVGTVGRDTKIFVGNRIGDRQAEVLHPGEQTWRPLYIERPVGALELGFSTYIDGWWKVRLENPGAGFLSWTVGINPAPTPALADPAALLSPGETLDKLSEASQSDLTGPLGILLLILALVEIAAGNHLFRRTVRE